MALKIEIEEVFPLRAYFNDGKKKIYCYDQYFHDCIVLYSEFGIYLSRILPPSISSCTKRSISHFPELSVLILPYAPRIWISFKSLIKSYTSPFRSLHIILTTVYTGDVQLSIETCREYPLNHQRPLLLITALKA